VVSGLTAGQIGNRLHPLRDANLDLAVNGAGSQHRFEQLQQSRLPSGTRVFNYDGAVNGIDFAMLSANFNQGAWAAVVVNTPASSTLPTSDTAT